MSDFDHFWAVYPKRAGSNPKAPARTKFERAVAKGAKPDDIIKAARAYAADPTTKVGTEFVAMAVTWLNQRRWEDYSEQPATPVARAPDKPTHGLPWGSGVWLQQDTAEWVAWKIIEGKRFPTDRHGGWTFPAKWPPDFDELEQETSNSSGDGSFPMDARAI